MTSSNTPQVRIRIIRKGNGLVQVLPYPAILSSGETFLIANASNEDAVIEFDSNLIQPKTCTIGGGQAKPFTAGKGPAYVEFDVELGGRDYAEGGSRPGAIIDP
jgi:hypothetical protein